MLREPIRIDGAAYHAHCAFRDAEITLKMPTHHDAVDDDLRPYTPQARRLACGLEVLAVLKKREGPMGDVEPFGDAGQAAQERARELVAVVRHRGRVQAALGIEHVLAEGLVEADG